MAWNERRSVGTASALGRRLVAVLSALLLLCGFTPVAAGDTATAASVIAFNERCSIFLIRSDGTTLTRLTRPPPTRCDFGASWSPDGKRIAFARTTGRRGILVMGANGSNPTRVYNGRADDPAWQPVPGTPDT